MKIDIYNIVGDKCTGCGGCVNKCPTNALVMKTDKDGFIIPVVNNDLCTACGTCTKTCPVLNYSSENNIEPKMYAVRASDEIRFKSSSGGMFTVLAEYVLSRKGVICGTAFDENMSLNHIIINNKKELERLKGSKYLQSHTGTIYRQIKSYLEKDTAVLFVGTPCQVAAIKKYLGKNYEKLITIDLLCHGVPSETIFKKYLNQKFKNKKIIDVKFRDKKFGWTAEHILVKFSDGTEYQGTSKTDPYLKAFLKNLDLRKSCEECPFSEFPRQGDFSLGDFWGITAIDKTQNDKKGTTLLYINNKKGADILKQLSSDLQMKEFPFKTTTIKNRVHSHFAHQSNRYRFFKMMENDRISFESAVEKSLSAKYDIGIVSNYYAGNFGGSLTQYALYNVLEDMGYSCLMIERPAETSDKTNIDIVKRIYQEIPYPPRAMATQRKTKKEMRSLNNNCNMFIVGSDQLFQYNLYKALGKMVLLDWVEGSKKKIAYAASFGHEHIWGDTAGLSEMAYFIKRFDAFSVREESGVKIVKDNFGVDAPWVLDPVFLCDKKHYDALIDKSDEKIPKHYIGSYILDPSEEKAKILKTAEKTVKSKAIVFSEFSRVGKYTEPLNSFDVRDPRVEGRLKLIKNSDFFITDSFHGTCFAIIMNKPFVSIMNKKRGASRFTSLLTKFHLEDRLIDKYDENKIKEIIQKPIDYEKVNSILLKEKGSCIKWLKNAITSEKKLNYSSYDVLINRILRQESEIQALKEMLTSLIAEQNGSIKSITEPVIYLNELARKKDNYIIIASVKDTAGMSVSNEVTEAMENIGFNISIKDKHWNSYVGILNGGETVFEKISSEEIVYRGKADNLDITVASRHYKIGNVSKNIINGKDYSVNRRGLNITVVDKKTAVVIDSVCFDMHLNVYKCYRK